VESYTFNAGGTMRSVIELVVCLAIAAAFAAAMVAVKLPSASGRRSNVGEIIWALVLVAVMYLGYRYNAIVIMWLPLIIVALSCLWVIYIRIRTGV